MTRLNLKLSIPYFLSFSTLIWTLLLAQSALTQEIPSTVDPGRIDQELRPPRPSDPSDSIQVPDIPDAVAPPGAEEQRFVLQDLVVQGVTVYSPEEIGAFYQDLLGQEISLTQLYDIANAITERYRADGYFLSRVIVPKQVTEDSTITLEIIENLALSAEIQSTSETQMRILLVSNDKTANDYQKSGAKQDSSSSSLPDSLLEFLNGTWNGTYVCGQGLTNLQLQIDARSTDDIRAIFRFTPHPSNPDVPSGSFELRGHTNLISYYRNESDYYHLILNATNWLNRPSNYVTVDLQGNIRPTNWHRITGNVISDSSGCTAFEITKHESYVSNQLANWRNWQGNGRPGRDTSRYQQISGHTDSLAVRIAPYELRDSKVFMLDEPVQPQGQTTFYTHGWNSNHTSESSQIFAKAMQVSNAVQQEIMVDWGQGSNTGGLGLEQAASRIPIVAEALALRILESGLSPDEVDLVGHSLGAYISVEAARILNSEKYGFFRVNSVTLLDPANLGGVAGVNRVNPEIYTPPQLSELGNISTLVIYDIPFDVTEVNAGQGGNIANVARYALTADRSVGLRRHRTVFQRINPVASHREPVEFYSSVLRNNQTLDEATRNGRPVRGAPGQNLAATVQDHIYLD